MQLSGGGAVNVIEATVAGFFSYNKVTTVGSTSATLTDQFSEHQHTVRIKLTNTPSSTFKLSQLLNTGEGYPSGLAQGIYSSLATLQYNFSHTILESPFATLIKPGKHALNLNGGSAAWSSMNAMVQSVELELMFTPGSNVTTAKTTVNCGPVQHLEAGELVQLFNLFANRDLSKINPSERTGGTSMGGGQVTLGSDSPKENSSPAESVPSVQNLTAPDATQSGLTNVLTHDATTGQIKRIQQSTSAGTVYTTGKFTPVYHGTGAPSATTLPANTYYRTLDRYLDSTAEAEYICTVEGTYNVEHLGGSGWSQISGNGWFFGSPIELPAAPYPAILAQQVIHLQPSHALVTTGIRDAANPTGPLVTTRPGLWVARQAVPAQATVSGNAVWNLPQFPLPEAGDYDSSSNFWIFLGEQYC